MLHSTADTVPGREIVECLGVVNANSVRAKNIGRDILSGFKNIAGGELGAYRELMTESRDEALERLNEQARELGADAIVALRLSTASVAGGAAEILAYGTAVKLR